MQGTDLSRLHVLGIRHHGPGSARAVARALDEVDPDVVLVEGAPELNAVLTLLADPAMIPPVAGLVYRLDAPSVAAFYPMAAFSPEWVAARWALARKRRVEFVDLPVANVFAIGASPVASGGSDDVRVDPLAALAASAGYDDTETWWEDVIEHRYVGLEIFEVVLDAMEAVRSSIRSPGADGERNELREAAMRKVIRAELRDPTATIATVCGAWHAPALTEDAFPTAASDAALLRGLPKVKVAATWVPWTSERLSRASGYGAGIDAPGWYSHLFSSTDHVVERWMTRAVHLLRAEGLDVSTAAAIDGVRLAEALAALRLRPAAGLSEVLESCLTSLCGGSDIALQLIRRDLLVGSHIGEVPLSTPMVPLERDIAATAKRLRLARTADRKDVELDLRTASGREKSVLLHRLRLLDVDWGSPIETGRTLGTFKEGWALQWRPELSVSVIEASGWGTTLDAACVSLIESESTKADLARLTALIEEAMQADLPTALDALVHALGDRSAQQRDIHELMRAVPPLARLSRYGDVRTRASALDLGAVIDTIVRRVTIGLSVAVTSLDDGPAAEMQALVDGVQAGLALLDDRELRDAWELSLLGVADQGGVHGAVAGRVVRLLLDAGRITSDDAHRRLSLSLSRASDHVAGASWLEAFLTGDAALLLHDRALLAAIDRWLQDVDRDVFDDVLPIVRRSFARWEPAERRRLGQHLRRLDDASVTDVNDAQHDARGVDDDIDHERARLVLPKLRALLGAPQ